MERLIKWCCGAGLIHQESQDYNLILMDIFLIL